MAVLKIKDEETGKFISIPAIKGEKGDPGKDGTMSFTDLTEEQKASLKGDKGDQGEQGIQGPKGDKGDVGPQGPQGEKGETGPQGPKGDTGETGATGPQGEQGPQGEKGDVGIEQKYVEGYLESLTGELVIATGNALSDKPSRHAGYIINMPYVDSVLDPTKYNKQIFITRNDNDVYIRGQENGVFGAWRHLTPSYGKITTNAVDTKTGRIIDGKEEWVKRISVTLGAGETNGSNLMWEIPTEVTGVTLTKELDAYIINSLGVMLNANMTRFDGSTLASTSQSAYFTGTTGIITFMTAGADRSGTTFVANIYFTFNS